MSSDLGEAIAARVRRDAVPRFQPPPAPTGDGGSMPPLPRALYLCIAAVAVAAIAATLAVAAVLDQPPDRQQLWLTPVLLAAVLASAQFPLRLAPRHQQELYPAVGLAAVILLPGSMAIGICACGQMLSELRQQHGRPAQWLFNTSVVTLQAGVGAALLAVARAATPRQVSPWDLLEVSVAGAAWFSVGAVLVECAVALQSGRRPWTHWWERQGLATYVEASLLVLGAFGALVIDVRPWALPLLVVPVAAIYHIFATQQLDLAVARSGRQRAEDARRRLTALVDATPDVVLTLDASSAITYANPAARALLGLGEGADAGARRIDDLFPGWKKTAMAAAPDGSWSGESEMVTAEGHLPVSQVVLVHRSPRGEVEFISTIARDIGERKSLEDALTHLANHDVLTGVFNRRRFDAELDAALRSARPAAANGALLYIDLDGFKEVNDTLGHSAGDRLLQQVAAALERTTESTNGAVGRLGGDEFGILARDADSMGAAQFAEHVLGAIRGCHLDVDGRHVTLDASIGVAMLGGSYAGRDELVAAADAAMYQAKQAGGGFRFAAWPTEHRLTA